MRRDIKTTEEKGDKEEFICQVRLRFSQPKDAFFFSTAKKLRRLFRTSTFIRKLKKTQLAKIVINKAFSYSIYVEVNLKFSLSKFYNVSFLFSFHPKNTHKKKLRFDLNIPHWHNALLSTNMKITKKKVPPKINHVTSGGHLQVKKGSPVRLECSASGNPMPNITWTRKNNLLPNGTLNFFINNHQFDSSQFVIFLLFR